MALTETAIRNAKPSERPYKLADGGGLYLLINPIGSRLWRLKYRIGGREKVLAIGAYPDIHLAKARERRTEARRHIADGIDPSALKKETRQKAKAAITNTFRSIAEEHLAKLAREGLADITLNKRRWLVGFAYPVLGERDVATITAKELLEVLRTVEETGRHETARRMRAALGAVFRYAIATARAENDPTFALRDALTTPKVTHRAAVTTPKAFGALLRDRRLHGATSEHGGTAPYAAAVSPSRRVASGDLARIRPRQGDMVHPLRTHEDAPPASRPAPAAGRRHPERAAPPYG